MGKRNKRKVKGVSEFTVGCKKIKKPKKENYMPHKVVDSEGNIVMLKKRVSDTKVIESLLSSKSGVKLTLGQYKLLMRLRVSDKVTPVERELITNI